MLKIINQTLTLTQNLKIQQGRNAGALADAGKSREEGQCADGVTYRLDHVVKTTITTILVTCVGCRIAIKTEMTYRIPDVGMKMETGTRKLEDPTTLPSTSDEHLQIKNQIGMKIATTITRAIPTHQSISQPTLRTTSTIA